ncbi:UPF0481 protein At3g47200-like [Brassica rapa]|uniref:Uncharacterized protein n=1 Tax=Brassica campestris TaxID=3711 RepID=M4FEH7_BRACM|nr:UPF0481 protein At3g47200-like [Brassica rapa]XP_013752469.2 UPF0481 protein At3g47200-like [Brassica napus]
MIQGITEQDIEKAESPNKDVEKANSSRKPKVTEQDIDEAESSNKHEISYQDDDEKFAEILAKMNMLIHIGAESPKFQRKGEGSCSIFKIPQSLKKNHHKGYEPEIVSIGPYHHGKEHLQMLEEHKHRYLKLFLGEAKDGVDTNTLGRKIIQMETAIRNSYSEKLVVIKPEFLKMMLLDGCFILMLFFFISRHVLSSKKSPNDRILTTPWILSTIRSDLLLLENQVPLILLNTLLKESKISVNLEKLAFKFFNLSVAEKTKSQNLEAQHLLDLIRKNFINGTSQSPEKGPSNSHYDDSRLILSANRLRLQGIKFKASHYQPSSKKTSGYVPRRSSREETILDIKLNGNELHIPPIVFDGFISSVLLNCVAFEQLSTKCSNNITSYVVFMGCLMNDEADATYLSEKGIIQNYVGNGSDVSQFFKFICKDVAFDMSNSYLKEEFEGINNYTSNRWNVECARFKHLHFDSPWTVLSSFAVLAAILLSVLQTIFGGLSYLHHCK